MALAACHEHADGEACAIRGLPGLCDGGLCVVNICGDGIRTPGEECDGDDLGGQSCIETFHFYGETTGLTCKADCTLDKTGCVGACGDGIKNGDELCDGTDLGTPAATCVTAGFYEAAGLQCSPFCTYDVINCSGTCGDHTVDAAGGELCDGAAPAETCFDVGFDLGRVDCTAACSYGFDGCGTIGWRFVASLAPPANLTPASPPYYLHGSAANDIWAVSEGGHASHFNGMTWDAKPAGSSNLTSVWSADSTHAWTRNAAGTLFGWDGTTWTVVPGTPAAVKAVWGVSATDVWVVSPSGVSRWNRTTWSAAGSITETNMSIINGSSANDVWISNGTLVRHWNGTAWSPATTVGTNAQVTAIYALGPSDAWAVGTDGSTAIRSHWNATAGWTMTSGRFGTTTYVSVTGSASNDVWISGPTTYGNPPPTNVEHWDGFTWIPVDSPALVQLFEVNPETLYGATATAIEQLSGLAYAASNSSGAVYGGATSVFSTRDDYIWLGIASSGGPDWYDGTYWNNLNIDNGGVLAAAWGITGKDTWIATSFGNTYHFNGTFTPGTFTPTPLNGFPPIPTSNMWGSSATDIWYAGRFSQSDLPAIEHYDGATWRRRDIASLSLATGVYITKVSGSGPNDVWALTTTMRLFHWTGTWAEVTNVPQPVEDMVVAGPGVVLVTGGNTAHHGNEQGWTSDQLPNVPSTPLHLVALAPDFAFGASTTDVFHYDGVRWSLVTQAKDAGNGPIVGIGLTANRLDIVSSPTSVNQTWLRSLVFTREWRCRSSEAGHCSDAVDNDCDGLLDQRDSDCP